MFKPAILSINIIVELLHQFTTAQAIIVERNYHTYYKLPIEMSKQRADETNETRKYYVLQCPYMNKLSIPHPQNMEICKIIGTYSAVAIVKPNATNIVAEEPNEKEKLHTKVDYAKKKPVMEDIMHMRHVMHNDSRNPHEEHPRKVHLKGASQSKSRRRRRKRPRHYHKNDHKRCLRHDGSVALVLPTEDEFANDQQSAGTAYSTDQSRESEMDASEESQLSQESTDSDEHLHTVLKYLNVRDGIDALRKNITASFRSDDHNPDVSVKTDKFFAENLSHDKGDRVLGYQNSYHRDEIYNDHIFYDDSHESGAFRNQRKSRTS